jgi:hypothetical protein
MTHTCMVSPRSTSIGPTSIGQQRHVAGEGQCACSSITKASQCGAVERVTMRHLVHGRAASSEGWAAWVANWIACSDKTRSSIHGADTIQASTDFFSSLFMYVQIRCCQSML